MSDQDVNNGNGDIGDDVPQPIPQQPVVRPPSLWGGLVVLVIGWVLSTTAVPLIFDLLFKVWDMGINVMIMSIGVFITGLVFIKKMKGSKGGLMLVAVVFFVCNSCCAASSFASSFFPFLAELFDMAPMLPY